MPRNSTNTHTIAAQRSEERSVPILFSSRIGTNTPPNMDDDSEIAYENIKKRWAEQVSDGQALLNKGLKLTTWQRLDKVSRSGLLKVVKHNSKKFESTTGCRLLTDSRTASYALVNKIDIHQWKISMKTTSHAAVMHICRALLYTLVVRHDHFRPDIPQHLLGRLVLVIPASLDHLPTSQFRHIWEYPLCKHLIHFGLMGIFILHSLGGRSLSIWPMSCHNGINNRS